MQDDLATLIRKTADQVRARDFAWAVGISAGIALIMVASREVVWWLPAAGFVAFLGALAVRYRFSSGRVWAEPVQRVVEAEFTAQEAELSSLRLARGVAQALLTRLLDTNAGPFFLEVRVSNRAARALYGKLGFVEHGVRPAYYHRPVEDALLLRRG